MGLGALELPRTDPSGAIFSSFREFNSATSEHTRVNTPPESRLPGCSILLNINLNRSI